MTQPTQTDHPNVRSDKYVIVESKSPCPQCSVLTAVFGLAVPADYETLTVDDDTPEDEEGTWEAPGLAAVLSFVEFLPDSVAAHIRELTPHYRLDFDVETGGRFWLNHCQHCGAQQLEEELHGEIDGPFTSMPSVGLEALRMHEIHEPFTAWAGSQTHDLKYLDG